MSPVRILLCIIRLYLVATVTSSRQFNLHFTERIIETNDEIVTQHDCLYADTTTIDGIIRPYQIIPYCLNEWPSKWKIEKNNRVQNFTFAELHARNITSQQLYLWSAPMDLIERYQFYLNQLSNSSEIEITVELFYNCTLPWFGPMCQYTFDQYESHHSSFAKMTHDFYRNRNAMNSLTCYTHLQCNRGTPLICLDWTDICNGIIDCIDGGQDEEPCWQLEVNDCQDNEYRCHNGQCISIVFRNDNAWYPDCLDASDETYHHDKRESCRQMEPIFVCEEATCPMSEVDDREFRFLAPMSCVKERGNLIMQAILSVGQNLVPEMCWLPILCITQIRNQIDNTTCENFCQDNVCNRLIQKHCPDFIRLPAMSLFFDHVYFVYLNETFQRTPMIPLPSYVCYNTQLCKEMPATITLLFWNNATCRRYDELPSSLTTLVRSWDIIDIHVQNLFRTCASSIKNDPTFCNMSTMYRCFGSSKCISIYRLNDGVRDCYHDDDEQFIVSEENSLKPFKNCYKCKDSKKCINRFFLNDGLVQCPHKDDESSDNWNDMAKHISFQIICDGFTELLPVMIDGRNETDETECEQWPCINTYTRCNGFWNCLNGADELNCNTLPRSNCTPTEHMCVSPITNQFMCLPIQQANDGINDCLGATDEPLVCRTNQLKPSNYNFYCENNSEKPCIYYASLCESSSQCTHGDDKIFCGSNDYRVYCDGRDLGVVSDVRLFFCLRLIEQWKTFNPPYFSLGRTNTLIRQMNTPEEKKSTVVASSPMIRTIFQRQERCHRGLDMRVWLGGDENSTTSTCLCPPNYYGDVCQYQNQRISLTLQIRAPADSWRTHFAFVIMLIDDEERIINSHEQITYLSERDCQGKFNLYLLYATRPKNQTKHYSIHIDAYEKDSLAYRASWLIPLTFAFLPVHRIVAQLTIASRSDTSEIYSDHRCIHGQSTKYINRNMTGNVFCRCNPGWSGRYCTIPYTCTCSNNSLCVGISVDNRSLCVCPIGKFGSRCLLDNTVCQLDQSAICHNGGQCVPINDYNIPFNKFICTCQKGFTGKMCEINDTKIIVSFEKRVTLLQSIFVHFIHVLKAAPPARVTTFKKLLINQNAATIYWSHPFHIMFIEPSKNNYYLSIVQKTYVESMTHVITINSSNRCAHISELFNETLVKSHLLHRIKYYHIPCQNLSLQLSCFYDDIHICLCTDFEQQQLANCFEFDHHMKHDCIGQSICENGAQCFQDNSTCPQISICMCTECFYGTLCQFTTQGFGLSLDAILGYHIRPNVTLWHQSSTVKTSVALTTIMFVFGLVNGILSLITFSAKNLRDVGCGLYLFCSSIISILTMIILAMKFWMLLLSQMTSITNHLVLYSQCLLIDFLVRICLSMDQWLNACVAIERVIIIMQGINFEKKKSKQIAKRTICVLLCLTIVSAIQDPIHRRLINDNDDDEQRTWCIVTYSPKLNIYNSFINIIHFLIPFLINIISASLIIIKAARQRSVMHPGQTHREHLRGQFREHKHLIITPCLLIILAFPRLYISFISGCMKSIRNPWLYLFGYFISFAPPMLTFVLFVLLSQSYKKEFYEKIKQYRNFIHPCLHFNLWK